MGKIIFNIKENESNEIKFQIKHIDILEFSFRDPRRSFPENSPFKFDIQIKHQVNLEDENILVSSQYNIYYDNDEDPWGRLLFHAFITSRTFNNL